MPVDPWIMLAGRPLQLPSINEQLHLREFARQMQVRNQVMQLNQTPGMQTPDGLYTNQGLTALGQIDPALQNQTVRDQAAVMAQRSLEYHRNMEEKRKQIEESQQIEKDATTAGITAWRDTKGSDEEKGRAAVRARNAYKQKYIDDGRAQALGWSDATNQQDFARPFSYHDAILQTMGVEKGSQVLSASQVKPYEEEKDVMEHREKPVEGISTEGLPLSDVDKQLQTRGLTPEQPVEQRELEPEKQHVEPPEPKEVKPGDEKVGQIGEKPVYGEQKTTDVKASGKNYLARADHYDKEAEKALQRGDTKTSKELFDLANHFRQRDAEDRRADIAEDREKRLKEIAEKKAADIELTPKAVDLLVDMGLDGNWQPMVGMARNQKAFAQVRNRLASRAEERGMTHQQINAALTQFHGMQQEARTLGARAAQMEIPSQELKQFIPQAEEAMSKVPRINFVPINRLMQMGQDQWSPEQAAFVAANRGVINAFAQVASRGVPTVHNTEEAEKMLSTAQTHAQYRAVLKQLWREAEGGRKAIKAARDTLQGEVSGKPFEEAPYPGAPDEPQQGKFPKARGMAPNLGGVPPKEGRKAGQIYDTPKGKLKWTGTGWVNP